MGIEQEVVWAQKYRPTKVKDCILPEYVKKMAHRLMETGDIPNLLFVGGPGLGKTTLAKAICNELNLDYLLINGSMGGTESGIEALRTNIMRFASTQSLISDKRKIVIFDEAENLSDSVQKAMRNFMDEYSKLCGFILTCNYPQLLLEPLQSRCTKIDFDPLVQGEKKELMKAVFLNTQKILTAEKVPFEKEVLAALIKDSFPDIRNLLCFLEGYAGANGAINAGALAVYKDLDLTAVIEPLKEKKWTSVRDWVFTQANVKPDIYSKLYKELEPRIQPKSKPALVIIMNEHQDKASRVVDKGICLLAALTEVMANVEFL